MKITFIYAYDNETWSTPISLINEFKKRNWEVDIISIGSNKTGIYHDTNLKRWIESKPKTDIVLFMDWGKFDSQYLNKSLVPAFWIQESGDDPQNFERNFPKSNRFHITITPSFESSEEYKNRGINAIWVPHWADAAVQYPIDIDPEYIAVTTRGLGNSQFLDEITYWSEGSIGNRNNLEAEDHTKFLNSGLMVIQNSRWGEITRRLFEGMACKKLVITDRLAETTKIGDIFEEGKDIIYYDNIVDCINKINYYTENNEEREIIAENGYKKVINNYTQTQVVNKLIEQWKNYQLV